jgi:hypothetical protein
MSEKAKGLQAAVYAAIGGGDLGYAAAVSPASVPEKFRRGRVKIFTEALLRQAGEPLRALMDAGY